MDEILGLIDRIYQAGVDSDLWPAVLSETAVLTGSDSCTLFEFDLAFGINRRALYHGADVAFAERLGPACSRLNPQIRRMSALPVGAVVADYMLMERAELLRSEFYRLWYKPQDITFSMGCCIQRSPETISSFALRRHGSRAEAFGTDEIRLMTLLSSHLQRANLLNGRLRQNGEAGTLGLAALQDMHDGIVLLDHDGTVRFLNAEASRILALGGGVRLAERTLHTDSRRSRPLLQRAIESALSASSTAERGGCIRIERQDDWRPLVLLVSALPDAQGLGDTCPGAMVVIVDLDREPNAVHRHLREAFSLTGSEAELATRITSGLTLSEIAGEMQWSVATAKSHLKRVFQKTGTHRQSDLMRLLLLSAGPGRPSRLQ